MSIGDAPHIVEAERNGGFFGEPPEDFYAECEKYDNEDDCIRRPGDV